MIVLLKWENIAQESFAKKFTLQVSPERALCKNTGALETIFAQARSILAQGKKFLLKRGPFSLKLKK